MTWLLPQPPILRGRVRTVGEPTHEERTAAKYRRYRTGPAGRAWQKRNRERRNAYQAKKQREYRQRRQAAE